MLKLWLLARQGTPPPPPPGKYTDISQEKSSQYDIYISFGKSLACILQVVGAYLGA